MQRLMILTMAALASLLAAPLAARNAAAPDRPPTQAEIDARVRQIAERLHPVSGDVRIPAANAVLHLGQDYYFLPANEARIVLSEAWGNPPDAGQNVLGMVFPAGKTFADDTWGAVVTYEATGYVNDSDAASTDYNELMTQMQAGESELNAELTRQGFPTQHVVGWAQSPAYDARTHSVVWARNIQFGGQAENTLNYDIRLLGRRGVLSLNMVTTMSKLAETRAAAGRFASAAEFTPGERYADFQPGTDRVAEYGIAGLIAAGVGATIAKKAGLLALILAFGKKAIVFILLGVALLWKRIRRLFGGGTDEEEMATSEEAPATDHAAPPPEPEAGAGPPPQGTPPGG
jgi:uncharacterized membrane-anchored protein